MRGVFITFEGIEGCGKSTQAQLLYNRLNNLGLRAQLTREPGGTELGGKIREILLHSRVYPLTELLLFLADRNQHVNEVIRPAVESGAIIISDRFYHSTYAYQATGRKIDMETVREMTEFAIEGFHPDLTLVIDVPIEVGFQRKQTADLSLDRIEQEDREFHRSIREAYLKLAESNPKMIVLDGTLPVREIESQIFRIVQEHFPRYF